MMQEKPTQELIVNDLQGNEWRFKHVFQGNSSSLMLVRFEYCETEFFLCYSTMQKHHDEELNLGI